MINNRQTGRRGRGRNGARPQGGGGGGPRTEQGNRIDNRSRGNANQLYEKYKTLARDSQTQGDRVMTEYYLQFADHYFRVLSESRARFEEQRQPRDGDNNGRAEFDGDYDDGDGFDADDRTRDRFDDPRVQQSNGRAPQQQNDGDDGDNRRRDYEPRNDQQREPRNEQRPEPRSQRSEPRPERSEARDGNREPTAQRDQGAQREQAGQRFEQRERPPRRPRNDFVQANEAAEAPAQIDVAVLPPAFALEPAPVDTAVEVQEGEEAPKRRRTRRPRREEPGNDVSGDVAA